MRIVLINSQGKSDITQLISRVVWSGDYSQVARKLEISITASKDDVFLPKVDIETGNAIAFYGDYGMDPLFTGYVFRKDMDPEGNLLSVLAYDGGVYLLKNEGAYNFKSMTAEGITATVCKDFGIAQGTLAPTGIKQNLICIPNKLYDIIMKAYTKAAVQNGKKYMTMMLNNKLSVIERGDLAIDYILQDGRDIEGSRYSESIESMVNTVVIVDDKGNKVGEVSNAEWVKAFGKLQSVYKKEPEVNMNITAKNMLQGIQRSGSIEALGNQDCVTGYAVGIHDSYTGMVGNFHIDSDVHTWENGIHRMRLELDFEAMMDEKTYRAKKKKAAAQPLVWN